ncbi:tripartite tricarboxylate transporter permease [Arthrobacter sp. NPDC089319]|uniref:tripartite tricarboxylate transporter permease n=1 Tax=Arthrobacter sp. NPDC089319 TaxID=3155915 RepID=UPI0034427968
MNHVTDGLLAVLDPTVLIWIVVGLLIGMLVGAFPGITSTMGVALASGFTLTLEPLQGMAVLITIYVGATFGDRLPAILLNTPGTPASISSTFDGYPLAKQGKAGLALTSSAIGTAVGLLTGVAVLAIAGVPLAALALRFGPAELFALVVVGITMMVGASSGRLWKGLASGVFGLLLATVGRDPITGDQRFTFGINELNSGIPFIPVIIGLFGLAEVMNQIIIHRSGKQPQPVTQLGEWWPSKAIMKRLRKPTAIGAATGAAIGLVPAVGGDIAGILGWENARKASKNKEEFGKGSLEGLTAGDTSSAATLGGSLTTTLALGVPGDSVMAVMIGSMLVWGITPGPALFSESPDLVTSIVTIMVIATIVTLILSLFRMRGVAKLLQLPKHYLWVIVVLFCLAGTFSVQSSIFDVVMMMVFALVGLFMVRFGFPPGPAVLGLILGPLAESNLRRSLVIDGWSGIFTSPIAVTLLAIAVLALVLPPVRQTLKKRKLLRTQSENEAPAGEDIHA